MGFGLLIGFVNVIHEIALLTVLVKMDGPTFLKVGDDARLDRTARFPVVRFKKSCGLLVGTSRYRFDPHSRPGFHVSVAATVSSWPCTSAIRLSSVTPLVISPNSTD